MDQHSQDDMANQLRAEYKVSQARFTVPVRQMGRLVGSKDLVQNVSFEACSGETVAIMGPSGAGKTTLLELVSFQGSSGIRTGSITLNSQALTRRLFQKHCAYVPQRDSGWWCLTCRETLQYTANLMLGTTSSGERVETMLREMGLESCADTRVGNEFVKGLSGGQRRRLSLAIALMGHPLVLFLDEITSGLDAASAAGIMNFLSKLTKSQQVAAISTIHQPSSKVFKSIDKLILLSAGQVAYCGPTSEVIAWFQSKGRIMPEQENPADFVLEQINKDFVDPRGVDELLEAWRDRGQVLQKSRSRPLDQTASLKANRRQSFCREVLILLKRQVVVSLRDPTVYTGRMLISSLTCLFFAFIYFQSRETTQKQAMSRQWLLAWHLGIPSLLSMVYCFAACDEFAAVSREVRSNHYRLASQIIAQTAVQLPLMVLIALCSTIPSGFGIGDWAWGAFLQIEATLTVTLWLYESLAQVLAVAAPHPALATMGVTTFWLVNFLFGGAIVRKEDVSWPLRIFAYISPYGYASRTVIRSEFVHHTFSGAVRTPDGSFHCPNLPQTGCYGITGKEVLDSLSQVVYNLIAEDTFWQDLCYFAGVAVFFKILFVVMSFWKCYRVRTVGPPRIEEEPVGALKV